MKEIKWLLSQEPNTDYVTINGIKYIKEYKDVFKITKEQILKLHKNEGSKYVQEWYPSVFEEEKKELVVGVWYVYENCVLNYQGLKNGLLQAYGVLYDKRWTEISNFGTCPERWREATPQEIQQALENEWKRLGGGVGVYFKSPINELSCIDNGIYTYRDNKLFSNGIAIFNEGKFASIVPQYTIKEAEERLNCKIV